MTVKPIPDDHSRITPYLVVEGVRGLVEFMKDVFDAEQTHCSELPDGRVIHAEVCVGDEHVMMGEPAADWPARPGNIYIYVEDCDATYRKAIEAGAKSLMEPADQFHGDRYGGVEDPFGNCWWVVTHVEDVSPEEMARREEEFTRQKAEG